MGKKNKQKTHKATAKRFKLTGSGKVKHVKTGDNKHYMTKMSSAQKMRSTKAGYLNSTKQANKLKEIGNLNKQ